MSLTVLNSWFQLVVLEKWKLEHSSGWKELRETRMIFLMSHPLTWRRRWLKRLLSHAGQCDTLLDGCIGDLINVKLPPNASARAAFLLLLQSSMEIWRNTGAILQAVYWWSSELNRLKQPETMIEFRPFHLAGMHLNNLISIRLQCFLTAISDTYPICPSPMKWLWMGVI